MYGSSNRHTVGAAPGTPSLSPGSIADLVTSLALAVAVARLLRSSAVQPQSVANALTEERAAVVDLTQEDAPPERRPIKEPELRPWNQEKERESLRGTLAKRLLWLLSVVIVLGIALLATANITGVNVAEARLFVEIVFSSVATLVGAVTGFYYGGTRGPEGGGSRDPS